MDQQYNLSRTDRYDRDEIEIDLLDLLAYYFSKLPIILGALIIGALIAGAYTKLVLPEKFTATARMYMVAKSSGEDTVNVSDMNLGNSLSKDYVELMTSRFMLEEVIDEMKLGYSYGQLRGMVKTSVVKDTRIVRIDVTSEDPNEAMEIANQIAMTAKVLLPKTMDTPEPTIAEYATAPKSKSSPSLKKNVLVGAAALMFLALVFITIPYLMDDTVKTSEDVEKEFGVLPLAIIPEGDIKGVVQESNQRRSRGRFGRKKKKFEKKKTSSVRRQKGDKR